MASTTSRGGVSPELLALVRCPVTSQPLHLASAELLARLPVPLEAALVREDATVAYPIRDGIPILLAEEAIPLEPR